MNQPKVQSIEDLHVFDDQHELVDFDDNTRIYCPVTLDRYYVSSDSGSTRIHCPGCGKLLSLET